MFYYVIYINSEIRFNMAEKKEIKVICPICKASKLINIKKSIIKQSSQLTTISIPEGKVCPHHFQAFVDKNFKVRAYQKIDYTYESINNICEICLMEIIEGIDDVYECPRRHQVHEDCLKTWLDHSSKCPKCQSPYAKDIIEKFVILKYSDQM